MDRRIRVPEVLVIDADGNKLGVMDTREALRRAEEQGLNLVEVAPTSRPPVCRILDYGRYKYDQKQAAKKKKKNQVVVEVKEVKFRPKVERHDYDFKLRHIERFLAEGNKVKATIMFRGRELAHINIGEDVLKRVLEQLGQKVVIENPPRLEGRNMSMQIAAKPGAYPKKEKPKDEEELEDLPEEEDDEDETEGDGAPAAN
ncbi:MAG: translation initiation factor IF-3 [Myxococcota bacterium]